MRKSIFAKYFLITLCTLLCSFIVLGGFLLVFAREQWRSTQNELLGNNVRIIANISSMPLRAGFGYDELQATVSVVGSIINADVCITNTAGDTVICSHDTQVCVHTAHRVSSDVVSRALTGERQFVGEIGLYGEKYYTVSCPVIFEGRALGVVFASVPMANADTAVLRVLQVLAACSILILIAASIIIYIITRQITRPLRLMSAAAKSMENGNFVQIPETSRKDEIGQLVEAFNRMSRSLGQLEGMRRSFISSVSHELKTPMTTISGFVDGILDGTIKKDEYPKYLGIVSDETKRLSRLVNSMLQLSRLESEDMQMHYSSFNVSDLIVRILLSFEAKIEEKRIDIRGLPDTEKIMLYADSDLIYQVIYNLVENAIKFTPEGGYIYVKVDEQHDGVRFEIENSGEGLDSVELSRIFERFYKTDRSRSEDKTGMGFGLYIVKTIVGLHGGGINAESVRGSFTKFTVQLPNDAQPAQISDTITKEKPVADTPDDAQ